MALAATKLVLEAGAYFKYEEGPSGIPIDDGWWTVETGYYYYFDNDHKVPKTSLKERKNQKIESESGLFLTLRLGTSGALNENPRPFLNKTIRTINRKLLLTLGKRFSNEEK